MGKTAYEMPTIRNALGEIAAEVKAQPKWVLAVSLALESVEDAEHFQQAIDAELLISRTRKVLVDARRAKLSTHAMNESMWNWVRTSQSFDLLAIINQSSVLTVAATMKARAIGTKKVAVFHNFGEATKWLGETRVARATPPA
jgi:hypothetical protein